MELIGSYGAPLVRAHVLAWHASPVVGALYGYRGRFRTLDGEELVLAGEGELALQRA